MIRAFFIFCSLSVSMALAQPFQPYTERAMRLVQSISFSPDSKAVYFALPHREYLEFQDLEVDESAPRLAIYTAPMIGDSIGPPTLMPFSGKFKDYEPSLSPDGSILFFNSNRSKEGDSADQKNNIWFCTRKDDGWSKPQYLEGANTSEFEESYPSMTESGDFYFVAERMVDSKSEYAVYSGVFAEGTLEGATKLNAIDQPPGSGDPWVSPDGGYLIYTKFSESNWEATCDLHISVRQNETWSIPEPLIELNGEGPDFAVAVSPDEKWIYYRKNYQFVRVSWPEILSKYIAP